MEVKMSESGISINPRTQALCM